MLGILWYLTTIVGAFMWLVGSSAVSQTLSAVELTAAAVIVGTLAGAWITYLVACCTSMLEIQTFILATLAMLILVGERFTGFQVNMRAMVRAATQTKWTVATIWRDMGDASVAVAIVAALALPLWRLYSTRMIPMEGGRVFSGGSCWADLPIHMTIAEAFLTGRNTDVAWDDMQSPVFAGEKLVYPFIPDWHAAVMVKLGSTMRWGFLLPGYLLCLAFLALLASFTTRVTRSRIGAVFAVALTLCAGGMGGVNFFFRDGWSGVLATDSAQNDVTGNNNVFWFAFLPHVFFPQRGANFAYPTVLLVLILVWAAMDAGAKMAVTDRRSLLMHAAGLAGMLPLVQAHSFIAVGIVISVLFVLDAHKWMANWSLLWAWMAAGVVAAACGAPQLSLFSGQVSHGHGGHFMNYGWIYKTQFAGKAEGFPWALIPFVGAFFRFWWTSLGPALPLFLLASAAAVYDMLLSTWLARHLRASMGPAGVRAFLKDEPAIAQGDASDDKYAKTRGVMSETLSGDDASFAEHMLIIVLHQMPQLVQDVITGRKSINISALDDLLAPMNSLSITGRALDSLKLATAAFAVFLVGNYINFQPWDRDNCKLFYVWVFIASAISGGMLAAPIEFFLGMFPGYPRLFQWTGVGPRAVVELSRAMLAGKSVQPPTMSAPAAGPAGIPVPATRPGAADAHIGAARKWIARGAALGGTVSVPVVLFLACFTGFAMIMREFTLYHQLLDEDQLAIGAWIKENMAPKAVVMHKDIHITPPGCLAGRPTLLGYTGWMWSHGYNYYDRDRDRNIAMDNALQESNNEAYQAMRRWGVRYIVGEGLMEHPRPMKEAYLRAKAAHDAGDMTVFVPPFDEDSYLDGNLRRVKKIGRFDIMEVQGYGFPPS